MSTAHRIAYDLGKLRPINDPGTGNSFDVKGRSMVRVEMISVGASETRTLPIPSAAGLVVGLIHAVDGGDIDLTVTSGFDAGGDTSMNTTTAGDFVIFYSIATAATTYRWRVIAFEGFTGITEILAAIDFNGLANAIVLDTDGDTTIGAPTDDQMDFKAGGTNRFRITERDAYDVDYNPATRVYARGDFSSHIYRQTSLDNISQPWDSGASANYDWIMSGSEKGSLGSEGVGSASDDGGCYLTAGKSASSGFAFIKPRIGGRFNKIKWNTNKEPRFRVVLAPTTITQSQILVGLYSNSSGPQKFDNSSKSGSNRFEVFLRSADSNWRVHLAAGTASSSAVISGAAAAAATIQDIDIRVSSSRIVTLYFDGVLVYTSTTALASNKNLIPIIGIQARDTEYTHVGIFHVEMSQAIQA